LVSVAQIRGGYQKGEVSREGSDIRRLIPVAVLIIIAGSMAMGEIKIENPKHLDVPEQKARVLLKLACQAVVNELHLSERADWDFNLRLVLGGKDEGYVIDQPSGLATVYLERWDEAKFTAAAVKLAVQKSIDERHEEQIIREVLRRSDQIAPVSAKRLRETTVPAMTPTIHEDSGCWDAIVDASQRSVVCEPLDQVHRR